MTEEYKDKCCLCRYDRWVEEKKARICVNQNSDTYGKILKNIHEETCENQKQNRHGMTIPLKDALKTLTLETRGSFAHYELSDIKHPFIIINFSDNEQLENWREAFERCFAEYMSLAEQDGDFEDDNRERSTDN